MSIHASHPFAPDPAALSKARQLRGRLPAPVTLWTATDGAEAAAWTVSSLLIADGDQAQVVALLKPDTDLLDYAVASGRAAITVLAWPDRLLADAAAQLAPAPGGVFTLGEFHHTDWGPVLAGRTWCGVSLTGPPTPLGWNVCIHARLDHIELAAEPALGLLRGRYRDWPPA